MLDACARIFRRARTTTGALLTGGVVTIAVGACGGDPANVDGEPAGEPRASARQPSPLEAPGEPSQPRTPGDSLGPDGLLAPGDLRDPTPHRPNVKQARCPPEAENCASASGRIVFVEAVDPDGDGDAHFVLLGSDGITAPGISVIDVRIDLRPDPLPSVGDLISAAGPVFPGSYGQSQIQADELNVARR